MGGMSIADDMIAVERVKIVVEEEGLADVGKERKSQGSDKVKRVRQEKVDMARGASVECVGSQGLH